MIRRLPRRTAKAPQLRNEQHCYGNSHLVELYHVANIYQIATGSPEALWNMQVEHE